MGPPERRSAVRRRGGRPSVVALDDLGTAWNVDIATGTGTALYRAEGAFGSVGAMSDRS